MTRQSKNARNLAKARDITKLHQNGEKGPSRTGTSAKKNAWWQTGGDYSTFVKGKGKGRGKPEETAAT
jgi:hypothetical protein